MAVGPLRVVAGRASRFPIRGAAHATPALSARSCYAPARLRPCLPSTSGLASRSWARPAAVWQLGRGPSWSHAGARPASVRSSSSAPHGGDPDASDPYDVLGVSRGCTDKDVKKAYLRSAQAHHPDMNPNDAKAADRFRRISMAYEALKSEAKRHDFDAGGANQKAWSSGTSNADTFGEASRDHEIIREAFSLYAEAVREEVGIAVAAAQRGDWQEVKEVAKEHSGIFAVLGALLLVLRFPMAVASVARFSVLVLFHPAVRQVVMRLAVDKQLWNFAWMRLIAQARRQRARLKDRKRDRDAKQTSQTKSSSSSAGGAERKAEEPRSSTSGQSGARNASESEQPKKPSGPRKR